MGVLNENTKMGAAAAAGGGYEINNSLRFNDDDSASLSFTPSSAGNRKTWSVSFWFKVGAMPQSHQTFFSAGTGGSDTDYFQIYMHYTSSQWRFLIGGGGSNYLFTARNFRDTGNWCHFLLATDSTQGTNTNRMKLYINGVQESSWNGSPTWPSSSQDFPVCNNVIHYIGRNNGGQYMDGYMADFHLIDGQQLTPSDFGEFDEDWGHWKPKKYSGSHGTNGFYLDFKNSSSIGNDASANSNHFTPTNIATSDQVTDTPTNNFCTFNSIEDNIHRAGHFGEGNLEGAGKTGSSFHMGSVGTMHTTNKIYYEVYLSNQSNPDFFIGIAPDDYSPTTSPSNDWGINLPGQNFHGACIYTSINTLYYDGSSTASFTTSAATGNILSCAFDPATGKIWFANNGTWYGSGNPSTGANPAATLSNLTRSGGASHSWKPCVGQYQLASRMILNCGQEGTFAGNVTAGGNADDNGYGNFKYSVPTGFLALCSANLPDPAVKPKENFNTVLYTGNSSAPRTITGVGFQPDMTWIKPRTLAGSWTQVDSVRGGNGSYLWRLASDYGQIESNLSGSGYVRSFASDGFVLGNDQHVNTSYNYLSWNWKTSSTSSGTTSGSGTSKSYTAKYNADAGFSIIGYEGNGTSGHQIPHHLGAPPELIIVKARNYNGTEWAMGTEQTLLSMDWNHVLYFDQAVAFSNWNLWHDTAPNNTHFYVSSMVSTNHNGNGMIAYCWRSIPGYCKIGSYQGVSDADGAFIYTGFRPAMVIIKNVNQSGNHFVGFDNVRSPTNPSTQFIFPSDHAVENTSNGNNLDFLSNGIKFRKSDGWYNHGNYKYLYMAFAEQPFKYSNAK